MKKILFLVVFALTAITTNATVITVNNGTVGAGQYTSVQDAVDASQVGDTIYIHGSQLSDKEVAYELCNLYEGAHVQGKDPLEEITKFVLKQEGLPENTENWEPVVIGFLNKYGEKLICPKSDSTALYDNEHFYKRAVSSYKFQIFYDLLIDDEYPVELNMIQIRNGKKETLLDFIEAKKKTGVSDGMERELNFLISNLRDLGAKYAREL